MLPMRYCRAQLRSQQELLAELRLRNAPSNCKRPIVPLLKQGMIAGTFPDQPQRRLQSDRLTHQRHALLAVPSTKETPMTHRNPRVLSSLFQLRSTD